MYIEEVVRMRLPFSFILEKELTNEAYNAKLNFVVSFLMTYAPVAEWQTQRTQNPSVATSCGFNSHLVHFKKRRI